MTTGAIAQFLRGTPLFDTCPPEVADKVAPHVQLVEAAPGATLMDAGSRNAGIGILMRGRASIRGASSHGEAPSALFALRAGDHFGEVGTLLADEQPHDVVAEDGCTVLMLKPDAVDQLCRKIPTFAQALAASLAHRLRSTTSRPPPPPSSPPTPTTTPGSANGLGRHDEAIPFVRLSSYELLDAVIESVPLQLVQQFRMVPLELRDKVLTVGMVDPYNEAAIRELRRVLHHAEARVVAISSADFQDVTRRLGLYAPTRGGRRSVQIDPAAVVFDDADAKRESERALQRAGQRVVTLASEIVATALERGASDIHLEPVRRGIRVRLRVNGVLADWEQTVDPNLARALIARFKVLAGLDIAERRRPQDGRIGVRVGRRDVDLRVSTLPASEGEKIAMRVLEDSSMLRPLEQIFIEQRTLAAVRDTLQQPYGAMVLAGPTGCGKTSTLYAALHERQRTRPETNIITVEDPIEYRIEGVTQVQVNRAVDLGFAEVLRAMLRQDPDMLMIGEVRDADTAKLAFEAAMTGHLLCTSIHANNSATAIQRLESFGCDRTMIAESVALILTQRLARRLCPRCTVVGPVPELLREPLIARGLYDPARPMGVPRAPGCDACEHTGLLGRVAIVESLRMTDELRSMLMAGQTLDEIVGVAERSHALIPFPSYASFMMEQQLIGPAEAMLAVAS